MDEDQLLTLEEAAARAGVRKRDLRKLVVEGQLPAVRADGRWRIAAPDLDRLVPKAAEETSDIQAPVAQPLPEARTSQDLLALIDLLRERDHQLNESQDERAQLTGQLGFLLGQLREREERIHVLEQMLRVAGTRIQETLTPEATPTRPEALPEAQIEPPERTAPIEDRPIGDDLSAQAQEHILPMVETPALGDPPMLLKKRNWLSRLIWGPPGP